MAFDIGNVVFFAPFDGDLFESFPFEPVPIFFDPEIEDVVLAPGSGYSSAPWITAAHEAQPIDIFLYIV
ncbi:MAG: hypothetical protein K9L59_15915 [Desulfobacterales bacterium]|nr:hypothetical protein [Desulfobacterales bacterium]